ncbi:AAA family ATPase [Streptomyces sp. NPDC001933]|uniref:AAA family ATPase n=1 Tax=Streptomyces sp. NPDC001933 TaxID=3364626 RepID=UPI003675A18F
MPTLVRREIVVAESYAGPVGRVERVPFVSRSAELGRLDAALKHMGAGGLTVGAHVCEAGIGKSRLLAEFSALARRRAAAVLRGRATEYEWHSPFQPFADAFTDLDSRGRCQVVEYVGA